MLEHSGNVPKKVVFGRFGAEAVPPDPGIISHAGIVF
jgi:hypothetical protein